MKLDMNSIDENGKTLAQFLSEYDPDRYRHPSVTTDIVVFTMVEREGGYDLAVMLIKRRNHPFVGGWALPGGFVEFDEEVLDGAKRELKEETGADNIILREIGTFSKVDRDPRTRIITVGHYGFAPIGTLDVKAGDDASDAKLFSIGIDLVSCCASAEVYNIELVSDIFLSVRSKLRFDEFGWYTENIEEGSLASDHSQILFTAIYNAFLMPRKRLARLLSGGRQEIEDDIIEALDRTFECFPYRLNRIED